MTFDIIRIVHSMGIFQILIAGTLVLMALASSAVFVERLWVIFRSRQASMHFAEAAGPLIEGNRFAELADCAEKTKGSHLAQLLGAGLRTFINASRDPGAALGPVELARRELERKVETVGADMRRGLSVLASVGSVAPFVGLLGTVVGIISAFQGIAKEGSGGLGAVSAGISEALIVTALGLLVAIPSVLAFNFLSTRLDAIQLGLDQARSEILDRFELAMGPSAARATANGAGAGTAPQIHGGAPREKADASPA